MIIIKIYNSFTLLFQEISMFCSTFLVKISLILLHIKFGKNIKFYGNAVFRKGSKNELIIGDNCIFRSKPTSNLIGVNRPCIISSIGESSFLLIGDSCGFSGTVIGCFKKIIIGNNVRCGANTLITDSDWHLSDPRSSTPRPIIINDNVWLGVNVIVLKGVEIGENSVIGAGSVVTKNIPPNSIAAGNPCKVIGLINSFT
jgi:acetyltransferase-like isoleucine patch superfamily enzyme